MLKVEVILDVNKEEGWIKGRVEGFEIVENIMKREILVLFSL